MRKECIFIVGECEEGDITIMQSFGRKRGEGNKEIIIFEDMHDIDTISSNFNFGIKKRKKNNLDLNFDPNLN